MGQESKDQPKNQTSIPDKNLNLGSTASSYKDYKAQHGIMRETRLGVPEFFKAEQIIPETIEHRVSINYITNYSLLAFPFQVLATNRMVESLISRKAERKFQIPGVRMISDFKDIVSVGGWRGLFRGFTPYFIASLINDLEISAEPPSTMVLRAQTAMFSMDLLFWNPLMLQSVRMQNLDYPKGGSFRRGFSHMMATEGLTPLYRGYPALLSGLYIQHEFVLASLEASRLSDLKSWALPVYLFGCLLSHPFFVLSARVQNAPYYKSIIHNQAFRDTLTSVVYTWKTQGLRGFYRGFAPAMVAYFSFYAVYLLETAANVLNDDQQKGE